MGFKCFCIKYRAIDIKSTSTSNLFSYISKDISAELVSFESEIGKDVEKVSVLFKPINERGVFLKKPVTWAPVVGNPGYDKNTSMVHLLAKKLIDTHKKLTLQREDKETNVIIFNICETDKDADSKFFNQMCKKCQNFKIVDVSRYQWPDLEREDHIMKNHLKCPFNLVVILWIFLPHQNIVYVDQNEPFAPTCDHKMIEFKLNQTFSTMAKTSSIRNFNRENYNSIDKFIIGVDWISVFNSTKDINGIYSRLRVNC